MDVTINPDQRLFVIPVGSEHFTTVGFDYVYSSLRNIVEKLGLGIRPNARQKGTPAQYVQYQQAVDEARRIKPSFTWFSRNCPISVQRVLERYRKNQRLIRIYYGDPKKGTDWMEELETIGTIGRSMGPLKVPLLVTPGESGGPAILDTCIVKLQDVDNGKTLWQCENYHAPTLRIHDGSAERDLPFDVTRAGEVVGRFPTYEEAACWVAFMTGVTCHGAYSS